jgi:Uma2 family endonuclease
MTTELQLNTVLAPPLPLRRFSVEEYHHLGEIGVLTPEDSVELLEGWIVEKMNQRPIHGFIVGVLTEFFQKVLPAEFSVRCQLPITTARSEPEPVIAIIRGSHADFRDHHPHGTDCRLVIEVADTSLDKDRSKAAIYREAGVQEYWVINVIDKCLERYVLTNSPSNTPATIIAGNSQISATVGEVEVTLDLNRIFS